MRRLSGVVLAGAMLILPALSQGAAAQDAAAQPAAAKPTPTLFTSDSVIIVYSVNQGKEADYEQVLAKLRAALDKSTDSNAKAQSAGWKVVKAEKSLTPDGLPSYIHIISPVIKGADYSIVNQVYAVSTDEEKRAFYDLYKGALKGAVSLMQGNDVKTASAAPAAAAP
jgi:hypothetical protein